jgi:hypothetical protein
MTEVPACVNPGMDAATAQDLHMEEVASLSAISIKEQALAVMQWAAEEAAGALGEVCMVLDEIALDMTFARHASRVPLRLASDRLESIARTLISEAGASGSVGAKHMSVVGKVALASATIAVLPFAEDAGHVAMNRFRASHERATVNLDLVQQCAESAQSETRRDLGIQIAALFGELDTLAKEVGVGMADQRRELEEAMNRRELAVGPTLEGLDHAIEKMRMESQRGSGDGYQSVLSASPGTRWERLVEIEFRIAEIFAQLTGDTPL